MAVVNKEYHSKLAWHGYNFRELEILREWNIDDFFDKLPVYRYDRHNSYICKRRANFPMMHYFYSLRPACDYKDWFLRFLASK